MIESGKQVKVTKIAETRENGYMPVGQEFTGVFVYATVGLGMWVAGDNGIRTSIVNEVLPIEPGMDIVRTMNSTYKVQEIR